MATLLDIVTDAADELGLSRPSTLVGSTAQQDRQLLAAANAAGNDLMMAHEWGVLQTSATITTANGTSSYTLASDYDRMISDTGWNRTSRRSLTGPDTPQINRMLNDGNLAATTVNQRFRIKGLTITIWPTPTAVETLGYEYVSNKWALSNASVAQTKFLADSDTSIFDAVLLKVEIKWRFMSGKGMYADGLKAEAMTMRDQRIASDLGGTVIDMGATPPELFIGLQNVADGSWSL